jgi:Ca2+-binding RTX toxin-like protein
VAISFGTWDVEEISGGGFSNVRIVGLATADTMNFSTVMLTGIAAVDGGAGNDTITGSIGNDTIVGGSGNDSLNGGLGDDTFLIASSAGTDIIEGGGGTDVIKASVANVAITFGTWTNIDEVSNGGFNGVRIVGTSGNNVIDLSSYLLSGIAAIDGLAGNDVIKGSNGADTIVGGSGADMLTGNGGADVFDYNLVADSRGGTLDRILDFTDKEDLIDFRDLDGNSVVAGDQALTFVGTAAFSGGLGELRHETVSVTENGVTFQITKLLIDTDGNKVADMEIQLKDFGGTIDAGDFLL